MVFYVIVVAMSSKKFQCLVKTFKKNILADDLESTIGILLLSKII